MSRAVFYIGPPGSGKTSAVRNLSPKTTFIINTLGKDLPWKGSAKQYTVWNREANPTGNLVKTSHSTNILGWLDYVDKQRPEIKDVVIDDNTFVTSLELLRRTKEITWEKFNDIASNFINLANKSKSFRDDLVVHILHHTQVDGDGLLEDKTYRAMSYGKLIDEKLCSQEAQFTIVLRASKEKTEKGIEYVFYTRDANSTAKAPFGMFEDEKIPNDILIVRKAIDDFYDNE